MSDVMQALQAYAQRQKNMSQDQITQVPGVPPSGPAGMAPPQGMPPTMSQSQFSNPANAPGRQMDPRQMQQLIMLLKARQGGGMPQPPQQPGMPPPM